MIMWDTMFRLLFKYAATSTAIVLGLYAILLALLTTSSLQAHIVYLHKFQMTWSKDLNVPELFGFLRCQVTPFSIKSSTGETLYAWHILPVELYRQHETTLIAEPSGFASNIADRFAFKLLRDAPDARLVVHFHGAGGTVGSGQRVPNYRALSAGQAEQIHVLTFDYRGFGRSSGTPSERGLCLDAIAVVEWAMSVAGVPPSRILLFGQSLGTAVDLAVSEHFALQSPPIVFAGSILVAPFIDMATIVRTYRIVGSIPVLTPLARFPLLFNYFSTFIQEPWSSNARIARYVRANEDSGAKYRVTMIHAEDDWDIPWCHTQLLFWHAVNATMPGGITYDQLEEKKTILKRDLGAAGTVMQWQTKNGVVREEIVKIGLHDIIMGYPVITAAVMRIFEAADLASDEAQMQKERLDPG